MNSTMRRNWINSSSVMTVGQGPKLPLELGRIADNSRLCRVQFTAVPAAFF